MPLLEGSQCSAAYSLRWTMQPAFTLHRSTRRDRQVLRGTEKKWEIVAEGVGAPEPVRLTPEQAKELQEKHQPEVLTSGMNRAKMNTEYSGIDIFKGADTLTEQDAKALNDSISVIAANLLKNLSAHVSGIEVEEGRGERLSA